MLQNFRTYRINTDFTSLQNDKFIVNIIVEIQHYVQPLTTTANMIKVVVIKMKCNDYE